MEEQCKPVSDFFRTRPPCLARWLDYNSPADGHRSHAEFEHSLRSSASHNISSGLWTTLPKAAAKQHQESHQHQHSVTYSSGSASSARLGTMSSKHVKTLHFQTSNKASQRRMSLDTPGIWLSMRRHPFFSIVHKLHESVQGSHDKSALCAIFEATALLGFLHSSLSAAQLQRISLMVQDNCCALFEDARDSSLPDEALMELVHTFVLAWATTLDDIPDGAQQVYEPSSRRAQARPHTHSVKHLSDPQRISLLDSMLRAASAELLKHSTRRSLPGFWDFEKHPTYCPSCTLPLDKLPKEGTRDSSLPFATKRQSTAHDHCAREGRRRRGAIENNVVTANSGRWPDFMLRQIEQKKQLQVKLGSKSIQATQDNPTEMFFKTSHLRLSHTGPPMTPISCGRTTDFAEASISSTLAQVHSAFRKDNQLETLRGSQAAPPASTLQQTAFLVNESTRCIWFTPSTDNPYITIKYEPGAVAPGERFRFQVTLQAKSKGQFKVQVNVRGSSTFGALVVDRVIWFDFLRN